MDTVTSVATVAADVQAAALRDVFVRPLVEQLGRQEARLIEQAEQIGQLREERDQAGRDRDRLTA